MNTTRVTHAPESTARRDLLVNPEWLAARLHDPTVRVVEVDVSRAAYDRWHIDQSRPVERVQRPAGRGLPARG